MLTLTSPYQYWVPPLDVYQPVMNPYEWFEIRSPAAAAVPISLSSELQSNDWIRAAEATYSEEEVALLTDVHALLMDDDGEKVRVVGDRGRYFSAESLLILEGDVQVQTNTGYRLTAPEVVWSSSESTISSAGGVELTGAWVHVKGRELQYDITSSVAVIKGDVRTRWILNGRST